MLGKNREKIGPLVRKMGGFLSFLPFTPNQFTFLALPLGGAAAYFLSQQSFLLGALFVLAASLVDIFDGSFAHAKDKKSLFGNYWDAMTDRMVEACFYFGLAFVFPITAFLALTFSMLISYAKPRVALVIEADNHDWPAIGERIDRLLLLIIGLFIAGLGFWQPLQIVNLTLIAVIVMTSVGFIQRIIYARKLIEQAKNEGKVLSYLKDKNN